jgi:hypothetical protein
MITIERAICPVCGREFNLTRQGTLRYHINKNTVGRHLPHNKRCDGAGKAP